MNSLELPFLIALGATLLVMIGMGIGQLQGHAIAHEAIDVANEATKERDAAYKARDVALARIEMLESNERRYAKQRLAIALHDGTIIRIPPTYIGTPPPYGGPIPC